MHFSSPPILNIYEEEIKFGLKLEYRSRQQNFIEIRRTRTALFKSRIDRLSWIDSYVLVVHGKSVFIFVLLS
jgi:hypothetical protein